MGVISELSLMAGSDISAMDITIKQPKLSDIRDVGESEYRQAVGFLVTSAEEVAYKMGVPTSFCDTIYALLCRDDEFRAFFVKALSLFVRGQISYNESLGILQISGTGGKRVDVTTELMRGLSEYVAEIASVSTSAVAPKFKRDKARELWLRMQSAKKTAAPSDEEGLNLANLIGAVSARSGCYNLINIWDLTIYQLQDQFRRIHVGVQLDIIGQRWAAWGKEAFDFSMWYKQK